MHTQFLTWLFFGYGKIGYLASFPTFTITSIFHLGQPFGLERPQKGVVILPFVNFWGYSTYQKQKEGRLKHICSVLHCAPPPCCIGRGRREYLFFCLQYEWYLIFINKSYQFCNFFLLRLKVALEQSFSLKNSWVKLYMCSCNLRFS